MKFYIIRHGEPDYDKDVLTENGIIQAKAAANRLQNCKISAVFASPMGRARQTAEYTAKALGLDVNIEPWAYETGKESHTLYPDGVEKTVSKVPTHLLTNAANARLTSEEVMQKEPFGDGYRKRYAEVSNGVDALLARYGYIRNADGCYSLTGANTDGIALFCHCAMTRMMLSHIMQIPINLLAADFVGYFTGISVLDFDTEDKNAVPKLLCYGDIGHLYTEKYRFDVKEPLPF